MSISKCTAARNRDIGLPNSANGRHLSKAIRSVIGFPLLPQWSAKNVSAVWSIRLRFDEIMDSTYILDGNLNCRSRRRESWNYCSFVPKIIPKCLTKIGIVDFLEETFFFFCIMLQWPTTMRWIVHCLAQLWPWLWGGGSAGYLEPPTLKTVIIPMCRSRVVCLLRPVWLTGRQRSC